MLIYADGACSGNPGPGGWAAVILHDDKVIEIGGAEAATTNNKMEMTAVGKALRYIENIDADVTIRTDSQYVIKGITEWGKDWKKKGWKTANGKEVANRPFWERLFELVDNRKGKIHWEFVKGHSGDKGNDRCDEVAVEFSKGGSPDLYSGPRSSYPYL